MDYTKITLGECLSSNNETIKRNAISILKQLQKHECNFVRYESDELGVYHECKYCGKVQ